MAKVVLRVFEGADALADAAADRIIHTAQDAIDARGRFLLVLAGGATPEMTYQRLARRPAAVDWSRTYIFFGDERFVPADDPRSNFAMARRTLLAWAPIPPSQVFPVPTDRPTVDAAARAYAEQLREFFGPEASGGPPRFDLILLGLGEDGHTASLFPGSPALDVQTQWATWSAPGILPPPVDRVTLTYPVLNAARQVVFLVAGERKASVLREILEDAVSPASRPAAGIRPADGEPNWFVDREASQRLSRAASA